MSQPRNLGSVTMLFSGCLMGVTGLGLSIVTGTIALHSALELIDEGVAGPSVKLFVPIVLGVITLLGALMIWGGLRLGRKGQNASQNARRQHAMREVLTTARARNGRLTLGEVILETRLSQKEAAETLQDAFRQGIADVRILDSGQEVYFFNLSDAASPREVDEYIFDPDQSVDDAFADLAEQFPDEAVLDIEEPQNQPAAKSRK